MTTVPVSAPGTTTPAELPGASYSIAGRPGQLVQQVRHILAWFERYRGD